MTWLICFSHRKKRMRQLQKKIKSGKLDIKEDDPFELFVSATSIRYCYYAETHKILGNTYGMCVLQDFEALTPNLLARTVETVEGGGIVVVLLRSMNSLKQLYTMTMVKVLLIFLSIFCILDKKRNAYSHIWFTFFGTSCLINKIVTNYRFVTKLQCNINKYHYFYLA